MSANVTFNGPEISPSSWPLEGVPGTLLDVIVDYVAQQARQDHVHAFEPTCRFERLYEKSKDRNIVAFTPNVKALSMVDSIFRHNVLSRKIFHTLEVGHRDDMIELRKKVQRRSLYAAVRTIVFLPTPTWQKDGAAWQETLDALTVQRNKLFLACPNVEHAIDLSGYVAYAKHHYPNSLTRIQLLLLGDGHHEPLDSDLVPEPLVEALVLDASGLRILEVNLESRDQTEHEEEMQSASLKLVIANLLQGCEELDRLSLQIPGLHASYFKKAPTELRTTDPIATALKAVGTLELDIRFCKVGLRIAWWPLWGVYLDWLGHTPVEFTRLHIRMSCSPIDELDDKTTPQEILDLMGIVKLSIRESDSKTYVPSDDSLSEDFHKFFRPILLARPELEEVRVTWFVMLCYSVHAEQPHLYRQNRIHRGDTAGSGKPHAVYYERIYQEVVDKTIEEYCGSPSGSPTSVTTNFDLATMPSDLPHHLAREVDTMTGEMLASVDAAVAPVHHPGEAEWEELD